MNLQNVFLRLLVSALWNREPERTDFPLSTAEWEQIYFISRKQTVHGLIYDAVCRLPEDMLPHDALLFHWMESVRQIENNYRQHLMVIGYLCARYETVSDLKPIILKGLGLASYYPRPNHRVSGDIDLYFGGVDDSEAANRLMEQWGIPVKRNKNDESIYMLNSTVVENHGRLISSWNPFIKKATKQRLEIQVKNGEAYKEILLDGTSFWILSPLQQNLLLMTHSLKHLLNEGIGLRQLVDVALFLQAEKGDIDGEALQQNLKDWGVYRWANLVYAFCVQYLGMPITLLPYSFNKAKYHPQRLLKEVWESGNFGQMDDRMAKRPFSGNSWFTAKRMFHNSYVFMKYAPGEAIGHPTSLVMERLKEFVKK